MLTEKTVDQILWVLELTEKNFISGFSIAKSYQKAVNEVANRHRIRYQTIADGCRRRLGLDDVGQLQELLEAWLGGQPERLKELLIERAEDYKEKITAFFETGGAGVDRIVPSNLTLDSYVVPNFETLLIRLSPQVISQLRDLAEFNGKTVPDFTARVVEEHVNRQYVEYVKHVVNALPREVKIQLLADLAKDNES